jgi:hypothetical protein
MAVMNLARLLAAMTFVASLPGQVPARISSGNPCICDPAKPDTLKLRQCSLCNEAEKHSSEEVFFLKDINPRKPTRWLALPRKHTADSHHLYDYPKAERIALWKGAVAKAKELWGDSDWGIAYNGAEVRTQCHAHLHIGKFLRAAENRRNVITVRRVEDIPTPKTDGIYVHPVAGGFHVHRGEQITETALMR